MLKFKSIPLERQSLFLFWAALSLLPLMTQAKDLEPLKKITITKTNNSPEFLTFGDWIQADFNTNYLKKLNAYVRKKGLLEEAQSEFGFVTSALKWVTEQWVHDGMNEPPKSYSALNILNEVHKKKTRYRCVEYGLVLTEVLQSFGFHTRKLALRSKNVAYGGFGQGHVAMEAWINDLAKWAFLDPQFGAFLTAGDSDIPLNYFEIFVEKREGRWDKLQVHFVSNANPNMPKDPKEAGREYKKFLQHYFGFISLSSKNGRTPVSLLLESQELPLTFQGLPTDAGLSTTKQSLLYPEMNRLALVLTYKRKNKNFAKLVKDLKIETDDDYLRSMAVFAAIPEFDVSIQSNPRFKNQSFEYRFSESEPWKVLKTKTISWNADKKLNRIEVRSKNFYGRFGPTTYLELKYE